MHCNPSTPTARREVETGKSPEAHGPTSLGSVVAKYRETKP